MPDGTRQPDVTPETNQSHFIANIARSTLFLAVVIATGWVIAQHTQGGAKGTAIPLVNVAVCVAGAFLTGLACKRFWITLAVPFLAGIGGAICIAGQSFVPYGAVLGFLTGSVICLLPRTVKPSMDSNARNRAPRV